MNTFGQIKSKVIIKLTESYTKENKTDIKNILSLITEDKNFVEMYLLYEDVENKFFSDKETAKFYVEELSKLLKGVSSKLKKPCKKINESIGNVEFESSEIYNIIDTLMEEDNFLNIGNKVRAKIDLVNYLTEEKKNTDKVTDSHTMNENLLHVVLANDFNSYYQRIMTEEDKKEFIDILNLSDNDVITKTNELKESILSKVGDLLSESNEEDLMNKLNKTKKEVESTSPSKYNYFKLKELKNGLD